MLNYESKAQSNADLINIVQEVNRYKAKINQLEKAETELETNEMDGHQREDRN